MYWWDSIAFSTNGQWLAKRKFSTVWVWEIQTGREVARLEHSSEVISVDFSSDGQRVVTVSEDGRVWVWEAATGKAIIALAYDWDVGRVVFDPEGKWVVTGDGYTVRVSDATTGERIAQLSSGLISNPGARFSPDGQWAVTDGCLQVYVYDATDLLQVAELDHSSGLSYGECLSSIALSSDGRWIATAHRNVVRVWDTMNWERVARLEHERRVHSVVFSPDTRWLASASSGPLSISCLEGEPCPTRAPTPPGIAVHAWEVGTWEESFQGQTSEGGHSVVFSPDGRWIGMPSNYEVRIWETSTGEEVAQFEYAAGDAPFFQNRVNFIVFGPDGEWVAMASGDGVVRVCEMTEGREIARLEHEKGVSLQFSPDWQWMATTSGSTVRIWNTSTWQEVTRLEHENQVHLTVFSPNWHRVATASGSTVCVWEVNSGTGTGCMEHEDRVSSVAFSPDGRRVATTSGTMVRIWFVEYSLIDTLCASLPRNLTQSEWEEYIGSEPYGVTCPNLPTPEDDFGWH